MILPSRLTLALGGALALSIGLNVFLGWQWAQAGAECKTDIAEKTLDSVARVGDAAAARDAISRDVAKVSDTRAADALSQSDTATQQDKEKITYVYVKAPADPSRDVGCTVLRPVPDGVQHVIEAAVARTNR